MTSFEKTELLLKNFRRMQSSDHGMITRKVIKKINNALDSMENDPYVDIIKLYYMEGCTRDVIADVLGVPPVTVSRNKERLINELKVILFSDDFIKEIYMDEKWTDI